MSIPDIDLVSFAVDRGLQMRIIEHMPMDGGHTWRRDEMVTAEEILAAVSERFSLEPLGHDGAAPAETFRIAGTEATVGVIASVTRKFCDRCDRVRLTTDGQFRNCLCSHEESDLRTLLRDGADDARLAEAMIACVASKLPGHGIDDPSFVQPSRPMSAIGGRGGRVGGLSSIHPAGRDATDVAGLGRRARVEPTTRSFSVASRAARQPVSFVGLGEGAHRTCAGLIGVEGAR